jgi:Cu(I)/Ag(I) efflux system membrane fusion protein
MANNNKGAVWLSMEEEIRNPYYGDAMLTCGSLIDSL